MKEIPTIFASTNFSQILIPNLVFDQVSFLDLGYDSQFQWCKSVSFPLGTNSQMQFPS